MPELSALLELSKTVARNAGSRLLQSFTAHSDYVHSAGLPREVKSAADRVLETEILGALAQTELAILSEESGYRPARRQSSLIFIVDPLDGTFNFVKGLGPSAVSIALWEGERPLFGVIYSLTDRELAWGGAGFGACIDGRPLSVSRTSSLAQASLCTGFPVRFDFSDPSAMAGFCRAAGRYAKVRMLGSAAVSLLHVARGSADVYREHNIMLWDVAAGIAIVEGAGGCHSLTNTGRDWCYEVTAANPDLMQQVGEGDAPGSAGMPGGLV